MVDFDDAIYVNDASTSTGSTFFLAEMNANLFQFGEIDRIEYRVDGRCDAFWGWLQRECFVASRDGLSEELPFGPCSAAGAAILPGEQFAALPGPTADKAALLVSSASRCDLEGLDALAVGDDTSIVLGHLDLGDSPFATLEASRQGAPAITLVETLAQPFGLYDDDGVDVYVWPAVAAPDFGWASLSDAQIAELSGRYGEAAVRVSIDGGIWAGFSVEVEETARWRSFATPLS